MGTCPGKNFTDWWQNRLGTLALTEAAAIEAKDTPINVIALCPGKSLDSRFTIINAGRDFRHIIDAETTGMAAVKLGVGETDFSDVNRDPGSVGLVSR